MDEAKLVIERLSQANKSLVTAESCTGGLLGKLLTDVPGASKVYQGGIISYAYDVKERLLGVDPALLTQKGAVCEEVAMQMAQGARRSLNSDFALAITGNAGPGTDEKNPNVGEIFVALASEGGCVCRRLNLQGSRGKNRREACIAAFELLGNAI